MPKKDVDVVVVGSGPNGLAAAIVLQQYHHQKGVLQKAADEYIQAHVPAREVC